MKEALIILPKADNKGLPLDIENRLLASNLVNAFGGVTARDATGYWRDDDKLYIEPVTEYTIACDGGAETRNKITRIAIDAASSAKQKAIYVRYPEGDVEIIDLTAVQSQAA